MIVASLLKNLKEYLIRKKRYLVVNEVPTFWSSLFIHRTAGAAIGTGVDAFLSEPAKIQAAVAGLVALTAGYYAAKGSLGIGFRFLEARLGKD